MMMNAAGMNVPETAAPVPADVSIAAAEPEERPS